MDDQWKYYAKWRKPVTENRLFHNSFPFYEMFEVGKSIGRTGSRGGFAWGWEGGMRSHYWIDLGVLLGQWRSFGTRWRWWLRNIMMYCPPLNCSFAAVTLFKALLWPQVSQSQHCWHFGPESFSFVYSWGWSRLWHALGAGPEETMLQKKKYWNRCRKRNKDSRPYGPGETEKVTCNSDLPVSHSDSFQQWSHLAITHKFVEGFLSYKQEILIKTLMIISGVGCIAFICLPGNLFHLHFSDLLTICIGCIP